MARKLKPSEYFQELTDSINNDKLRKISVTADQIKYIHEHQISFWVDEMQRYGQIQVPIFADMQSITKGGKYQHVPKEPHEIIDENDKKIKSIYIEPYQQLRILPVENFKKQINGNMLTKAELKKQKEIIKKDQLAFEKVVAKKQANIDKRNADKKKTQKQLKEEEYQRQIDNGTILSYGEE